MVLIELSDIERNYLRGSSSVRALRGASLVIEAGEFVAIMGPSGSGKSTLLHVIGTLDRPDGGRYAFEGAPMEHRSDAALARFRNQTMGFVFQQFHLLSRDTALENVELPLIYAGVAPNERRRRALEALDRVGLGERWAHRPAELSGGQQQRVSIARALVNMPKVILADEPTGALDSSTSRAVMALLKALHGQGVTIILVTHDHAIARYAERVIHVSDGSIVRDEYRTGGSP